MEIENIDIKKSCEYRWRKNFFNLMWIYLGIVLVVSLVASLVIAVERQSQNTGEIVLLTTGIMTGTYLIVYAPIALYYLSKARYLANNYKNFSLHEVRLDNIKTSYWYRYYNYYTVTITVNGSQKEVNTNPLFSGIFFNPIKLADYNNQQVYVLYDEYKDKVYVIDKVK